MKENLRKLLESMLSEMEPGEAAKPEEKHEEIVYGMPELKRYPLDTPQRVVFAVRIFDTLRDEFHPKMASAIISQARKFNIDLSRVGEKSLLRKYLPKESE